ncbi:MAG: arginyltransferase [Sedimenticola sp.]|nr:MAG: arginyltransferase [Sedimenticola sp.]
MTDESGQAASSLRLYITPQHPCSYLPDHQAKTLFLDPHANKNSWLYQALIEMGFRRSGDMIYRPECDDCQACVPVRLPVNQFTPNRSQRRAWQRSVAQMSVEIKSSEFNEDHYRLYESYISDRHPGGEMADTTVEKYLDFLTCSWNETLFIEFRLDTRIAAVAVTDVLPSGLSAVYTFFDPAIEKLSPGVFALLWQIELAKKLQLPWLYLGYWVPGCRKMEYKTRYQPIQVYRENQWQNYQEIAPITLKSLSRQKKI